MLIAFEQLDNSIVDEREENSTRFFCSSSLPIRQRINRKRNEQL